MSADVVLTPGEWTPQQAATHVSEAWQNAVESIVETGRRLIEAKQRVGHGWWLDTVALLPFSERTARALMQVATHPDLGNRQHAADLPASWYTLSVLAQLPPGEVAKRIESGEITPDIDRATAQEIAASYRAAEDEERRKRAEERRDAVALLVRVLDLVSPLGVDQHDWVESWAGHIGESDLASRTEQAAQVLLELAKRIRP